MAARFDQPDPMAGRDSLSAADVAELMRWVRRLAQSVRPLSVTDDSGLHARARVPSAPFWARITGRDAMSNQYSWVEQRFNVATQELQDKPGGRSGAGGGTHPAFEANGATQVPTNTIVLLHRIGGADAYLFDQTASTTPAVGCSNGYKTVDVVTDVTCNGDGTISVTTETICVRDV